MTKANEMSMNDAGFEGMMQARLGIVVIMQTRARSNEIERDKNR